MHLWQQSWTHWPPRITSNRLQRDAWWPQCREYQDDDWRDFKSFDFDKSNDEEQGNQSIRREINISSCVDEKIGQIEEDLAKLTFVKKLEIEGLDDKTKEIPRVPSTEQAGDAHLSQSSQTQQKESEPEVIEGIYWNRLNEKW